MRPDSWLSAERAGYRLERAGYEIEHTMSSIKYRKRGVSGRVTVHPQGVDEWAILRLEDRGS